MGAPKFEMIPGETLLREGYLDHWKSRFSITVCHGWLTNTRFVACKKPSLFRYLGIVGALLLMTKRSTKIHFDISLEQITGIQGKRYGLVGRKTIFQVGDKKYVVSFGQDTDEWHRALVPAIQAKNPNVELAVD